MITTSLARLGHRLNSAWTRSTPAAATRPRANGSPAPTAVAQRSAVSSRRQNRRGSASAASGSASATGRRRAHPVGEQHGLASPRTGGQQGERPVGGVVESSEQAGRATYRSGSCGTHARVAQLRWTSGSLSRAPDAPGLCRESNVIATQMGTAHDGYPMRRCEKRDASGRSGAASGPWRLGWPAQRMGPHDADPDRDQRHRDDLETREAGGMPIMVGRTRTPRPGADASHRRTVIQVCPITEGGPARRRWSRQPEEHRQAIQNGVPEQIVMVGEGPASPART